MQAELKKLHSPDVPDLKSYRPEVADSFGFLVRACFGPKDQPGEESFDFILRTPEWLKRKYGPSDVVVGRHKLIVFEYDYERLVQFLERFALRRTGTSWPEIAGQLCRLGMWEFEDYRDSP